jgi:large subunit ribosomal protein L3
MTGIIGKKLGMTRVIQDDGRVIPITVVHCEPNEVTQVKTVEKDGYPALVLGFSAIKKATKNRKFHHQKEFRVEEGAEQKKGDRISLEIFNEGDSVKITGTSKGKGFQGVIRRYNMSRGPMSHGSHHKRQPGSVGACAYPGRIHKGKKLPGRMGNRKVTISRSSIVYLDKKNNIIGIKGALPGAKKSIVTITRLS